MLHRSSAVEGPPRRWRAPPLLRASLLWHLAALALTVLWPRWWPWTLAAVVADHLLLTALGLWPRSRGLGPNLTRLPPQAAARGEVGITIDDGPDPDVTPPLLRILAEHDAHATFFCIGERVERYPQLVRACAEQGHAVENHSQRHAWSFPLFGLRRLRRELEAAQRAIERACGSAPRFFRAPAGLRSPLLEPILQRLGLRLASWTHRGFDTVQRDPRRVLSRLTRGVAAGDILLLHDGHAARTAAGTPVVLEVLPALLATLKRQGLRSVTLREASLRP